MVIHSSPPDMDEDYEKLNLLFKRNSMYIEGFSMIEGVEYKNHFLIHSGYGGSILFDDKFVNDHDIGSKLPILSESELKDSQGNVLKTKKATLPNFSIGKTNFADIPVGFFEGSIGRQRISVVGGDVLKRFNIMFDLQNDYIYLKPNGLMNSPYSEI